MPDIGIIGAGRVGTTLGRALAAKGYRIRAVADRSLRAAKEGRRLIGQGRPVTDIAAAAAPSKIVILCLPDAAIRAAALRLAGSGIDWRGKTVLHTSGALPSAVLSPLRKMGAALGSIHPACPFPEKGMPPSRWRRVSFGVEGDPEAVETASGLVRDLGGRPLVLSPAVKPLYHAACIMASNYPVILWQAAAELLDLAGIAGRRATQLIAPLAEGTLRNVKKLNPERALTGPIVRGDAGTVKAHLEALARLAPQHLRLYREVGLAALETARSRGLAAGKIRTIRALLAGGRSLPPR